MKAVATVSGADFGHVIREGLRPKGATTREQLLEQLKGANELRSLEAKDGDSRMVEFLPKQRSDIPESAPDLTKKGWHYYRTPRSAHPRSTATWVARSMDLCAKFDVYRFMDMISPLPLLVIAGEKADTRYFSEDAIDVAKEPKEL